MKKNLAIIPIGKTPLLNQLHGIDRNFDTLLICYEDNFPDIKRKYRYKKNIYVTKRQGFKFPLIKQLYNEKFELIKGTIIKDYDYVALIDDDVLTKAEDINTLFNMCSKYKFKIASPCIAPLNYWHDVMFKHYGCSFHHVSWMETMFSIYDKETLSISVDYFDEAQSGWGFVELFYKKACEYYYEGKQAKDIYTVIDDVEIIHTKPLGHSGGIYDEIDKPDRFKMSKDVKSYLDIGHDECQIIFKKHNLKVAKHITHLMKFHSLCSAVIITSSEDKEKYILKCLESLPVWCKVLVFETVKGDKFGCELLETTPEGHEFYKMTWAGNKFPYATCRNIAKSYSNSAYILSIDADERLNPMQHDYILRCLKELSEPRNEKIYGIISHSLSLIPIAYDAQGMGKADHGTQCRIFKNLPFINWYSEIHEAVSVNISRHGGKMKPSEIIFYHEGYKKTVPEMRAKIYRNITTAYEYPEMLRQNKYFNSIVNNPYIVKLTSENEKLIELDKLIANPK